MRKLTTDEFISKAEKIHGNKYDYSNFLYKNNRIKEIIICNIHGKFSMNANHHLLGKGCPKCSGRYKNTNDIVEEFEKVHGNSYDYSKFVFNKNYTKSIVTCFIHGDFLISSNKHINNRGCPKCKESHGERKIRMWLEYNNTKYEYQKEFVDCKNIKPLKFDFYIPSKNLLIEFDGHHHSNNDRQFFNRNEDRFKYQIKRDNIKSNYCLKKEIKLLRIDYKQINNIKEILEENIN